MRIGIIGAGVAGLTAAHLLAAAHDVVVLEADDRPGGHAHTHTVRTPSGSWRVDTGFMVFNDRNYPLFTRLLERLGVDAQRTDMRFSVADEHGRFEYCGGSPAGLLATPANALSPRFWRMVGEYVRFNREARALLAGAHGASGPSLPAWLEHCGFSDWFVDRLIVPQVAAVWSADPRRLWDFPARFLAEFFDNHGMLSLRGRPRWYSIPGGSARYVDEIARRLGDRLRLRTPVRAIARDAAGVTVLPQAGEPERFDHVIVAAHADQALAMLADPTGAERELLGAFPYHANDCVLHTDERLLPRRRRAWGSWNFHLLDAPPPAATVTYHLNRLQRIPAREQILLTLNRADAIDPAKIVARMTYHHPVYTAQAVAAQRRHSELCGPNRTSYCGAYWGWGFHEDGVASAVRACAPFGVSL